jgi:hypothetical protein
MGCDIRIASMESIIVISIIIVAGTPSMFLFKDLLLESRRVKCLPTIRLNVLDSYKDHKVTVSSDGQNHDVAELDVGADVRVIDDISHHAYHGKVAAVDKNSLTIVFI